jgi:transcriptional regulator with XRE-family HTH domain
MNTDNMQQHWGEKPVELEMTLGDRLRKSLWLSGLSVAEMAEALEIHRNTVSGWLAGRARPAQIALRFWAQTTSVPLHWLLEGEWPEDPTPAKKNPATTTAKKPTKKAVRSLRGNGKKR